MRKLFDMVNYLTQEQLAEDYSVGIATIRRAKADGVDVQNREHFKAWIYTNKRLPPAWGNGPPWEQADIPDPHLASSGERDLMERVRTTADYNEARTLKTQIDAIHKLRQIEILEGDYIHKADVENDMTRIGAAVRAAHKQCQADLPAMLEGLSAAKAKVKISEYLLKIDAALADETGKLYK